ncbi:MAG: hypothetical protein GWM91_11450, partial [Actinobacteria bacterium]|nr:hypothetical protein [Actinomycetota bacterium]NIX50994.1 hypothetical protein [Actinomycetota bacterium]
MTEEQTIVYTDAPPGPTPPSSSDAPPAPWHRDVPTDAALLFRFSALT